MWRDIGTALSLVLVIEGIMPFIYPQRFRQLVAMLAQVDNATLRMMSLFSMLAGTALLYFIR